MSLLNQRPYTFDRVVRLALTLGVGYGIFMLLDYLQSVLVPFAVAVLLAYLIEPIVRFFQHKARFKSRILSILAALVTVVVLFTGVVMLIAPTVVSNVQHAGELLSKVAEDNQIDEQARSIIPENLWNSIQETLQNPSLTTLFDKEGLPELTTEALQRVLPEVVGVFSSAFNIVVGILGLAVIILYLIFILIDFDSITKGWHQLVPQGIRPRVEAMVHDFGAAMSKYFRAQALIATSVGILFAIGFSLISLPLGILFGLFVGLLNMVPYLQNIAIIPAALLAFIHALDTGQSFWFMMLLVLAVFAVVQAIQDLFLTPRIMGDATGLNPAMIMLSLSIWGKLLGLLGLIIALPMTFLLLSYYRKFLAGQKVLAPMEEGPPCKGKNRNIMF